MEVFRTDDRTTSSQTTNLQPGEPVKFADAVGSNFVIALATGDAELGTDIFAGIVRKASTETSSADGTVEVEIVGPGTIVQGKATTTTNVNTDAKLLGIVNDYVCFDVTGAGTNGPTGVFTIDEDEGTDPNVHTGIILNSTDITTGKVNFLIANATFFGQTA